MSTTTKKMSTVKPKAKEPKKRKTTRLLRFRMDVPVPSYESSQRGLGASEYRLNLTYHEPEGFSQQFDGRLVGKRRGF